MKPNVMSSQYFKNSLLYAGNPKIVDGLYLFAFTNSNLCLLAILIKFCLNAYDTFYAIKMIVMAWKYIFSIIARLYTDLET